MTELLSNIALVQKVIQEEVSYISTDDTDHRTAADLVGDVCDTLEVEQAYGRVQPEDESQIVVLVAERGFRDFFIKVHNEEDSETPTSQILRRAARSLIEELPTLPSSPRWLQALSLSNREGVIRVPEEEVTEIVHQILANGSIDFGKDTVTSGSYGYEDHAASAATSAATGSIQEIRVELAHLLSEFDPEQLANLDSLLLAYKGREEVLLSRYRKQKHLSYKPEVESLVRTVDPAQVNEAEELLDEFAGRESELIEALQEMSSQAREQQDSYRGKIEQLVRLVDPDQIENIDDMLLQFKGREKELLAALKGMCADAFDRRAKLRSQVTVLLETLDADRLGELDSLMEEYRGKESVLIENLKRDVKQKEENREEVRRLLALIGSTSQLGSLLEKHKGRESELVSTLRKLANDKGHGLDTDKTSTSSDVLVEEIVDDDDGSQESEYTVESVEEKKLLGVIEEEEDEDDVF